MMILGYIISHSIRWVNYQGLLEACLVGKLVDDPQPSAVEKQLSLPPPLPPPGIY